MRIYNTLSRSIEEFKPQGDIVSIYTCGPTTYDFMHIGNLRTFLLSDLFERTLRANGLKIKTVQNITDIDDKIIRRAGERGIGIAELSHEFEEFFLADIKSLNILPKDEVPHATAYIQKMEDYIASLIDQGFAYVESDGSVYFDISKFPDYGKLSGIEAGNLKSGTRILSDEYSKDDVQDFALWKAESKDTVGYASRWGWGRPGWHIECSVMSQENLGETLDVHMGGTDLIFPHHENEIAQSEAKTGKMFVKYWMHGAFMLVDGKKMSKSLGNFYRLKDITDKNIEPLALRYLYLQTHYRQEMNFTWEALEAAQTALKKLWSNAEVFGQYSRYATPSEKAMNNIEIFMDAINNDLNMPAALSALHKALSEVEDDDDTYFILDKTDKILGLNFKENGIVSWKKWNPENIPGNVLALLERRSDFRKAGNYDEADKIRSEIDSLGFIIEDSASEIKIRKK